MGPIALQAKLHVNTLDDQDFLLGFDFSDCFGNQAAVSGRNLTRFQRASEGTAESTRGARDDVIESCRPLGKGAWRKFVVLGDRAMDTKGNRLPLTG